MTYEKKSLTYHDAGVNIDAGNDLVHKIKPLAVSTYRPGASSQIGGFGGIFDLKAAGFQDPVLVAANDGVGTKLRIAIEAGIHHTIGIDLVAMCVNDLIVQGAEPLFFLDYFATGKLKPEQGVDIINGITKGCIQAGCALIGGETAEMPGMYHGDDYDLAGFAVGACERDRLLPGAELTEGDVLLGLTSSGIHSNGFSLVRKIIEMNELTYNDPTPFDTPGQGRTSGQKSDKALSRTLGSKTLGENLLEPTRIYVRPLLYAMTKTKAIKAMAHITGGGFFENIPRVLPNNLAAEIHLDAINVPDVFSWLSRTGGVSEHEMLRTFNCGIGMVIAVDKSCVRQITKALTDKGEGVIELGQLICRHTRKSVVCQGRLAL